MICKFLRSIEEILRNQFLEFKKPLENLSQINFLLKNSSRISSHTLDLLPLLLQLPKFCKKIHGVSSIWSKKWLRTTIQGLQNVCILWMGSHALQKKELTTICKDIRKSLYQATIQPVERFFGGKDIFWADWLKYHFHIFFYGGWGFSL